MPHWSSSLSTYWEVALAQWLQGACQQMTAVTRSLWASRRWSPLGSLSDGFGALCGLLNYTNLCPIHQGTKYRVVVKNLVPALRREVWVKQMPRPLPLQDPPSRRDLLLLLIELETVWMILTMLCHEIPVLSGFPNICLLSILQSCFFSSKCIKWPCLSFSSLFFLAFIARYQLF